MRHLAQRGFTDARTFISSSSPSIRRTLKYLLGPRRRPPLLSASDREHSQSYADNNGGEERRTKRKYKERVREVDEEEKKEQVRLEPRRDIREIVHRSEDVDVK